MPLRLAQMRVTLASLCTESLGVREDSHGKYCTVLSLCVTKAHDMAQLCPVSSSWSLLSFKDFPLSLGGREGEARGEIFIY